MEIDGNGARDFNDPEHCVFQGLLNQSTALIDVGGKAPACLNLTVPPDTDETWSIRTFADDVTMTSCAR